MTITKIEKNGIICAIVSSDDIVITDVQSALDVLMPAKYDVGTKNIVISKKLVFEDFFILSSGLAGEVLHRQIRSDRETLMMRMCSGFLKSSTSCSCPKSE